VTSLKRKAESAGGQVVELNTWVLKMSQYDHCTETCTKKPLSQRWHVLGDGSGVVQRDVYSALLAFCTDGNTHNPSSIAKALAAQESVLRRTGLWKTPICERCGQCPGPGLGRQSGWYVKEGWHPVTAGTA
jgi:hypothetical protein